MEQTRKLILRYGNTNPPFQKYMKGMAILNRSSAGSDPAIIKSRTQLPRQLPFNNTINDEEESIEKKWTFKDE